MRCGNLGHYRNKCPARNKGGPAETPGGNRKGKGGRIQLANLASGRSSTEAPQGDEVGVQEALERVTATMYSISPKTTASGMRLGPVPTAEVELEGEVVEALLDTGSQGPRG